MAGQFSGAIAISALLAGGCDLFDRAILQSGGLERVRSTAAASAVAEQIITTGAMAGAEEPGVEEILAAQRGIAPGFVPPQGPFHPCIDGDIIEEHPLVVARTRDMPAVPLLAGTTRDEKGIFDAALDEDVFTERYVRGRAHAHTGDGHDADAMLATYRADHHTLCDVANAMVTDYHFTAPTEQFVRAHAERGNAVFVTNCSGLLRVPDWGRATIRACPCSSATWTPRLRWLVTAMRPATCQTQFRICGWNSFVGESPGNTTAVSVGRRCCSASRLELPAATAQSNSPSGRNAIPPTGKRIGGRAPMNTISVTS